MSTTNPKNYVTFVQDHSGSMSNLESAAIKDYNATIAAIKGAANREMLDTVVSAIQIGVGKGKAGTRSDMNGYGTTRSIVTSNPHVLRPMTHWPTNGGTPLWDGVADAINLSKSVLDFNNPNVSFLIIITTDGQEEHSSYYTTSRLASLIEETKRDGRFTIVFRVPEGGRHYLADLGISPDNIQEWSTTKEGMAKSTEQTTKAVDSYFSTRSTGAKSSTVFYADATKVDTSVLVDISKEVSLYVVTPSYNGREIRDFVLSKRQQYLKGAAFYQLTKTEAKISKDKLVLIRDRNTGAVYAGKDARKMIGLPTDSNARLHPGNHGAYDIFIQSESVNRHLVAGTGLIYWEKVGTAFTEEDLNRNAKPAVNANGAVILPTVVNTGKPTPSPLKAKAITLPAAQAPVQQYNTLITTPSGVVVDLFYDTRNEARKIARLHKMRVEDNGVYHSTSKRWSIASK